MLEECPHCYTAVIPMNDGTCPTCRKNTKDKPAANSDMTRIVLRAYGMRLPNVCAICGQETSHLVRFSKRVQNPRYETKYRGGGMLGLILTWLGSYFSGDMHSTIAMYIPNCERCCVEHRELKVLYLDFENESAAFVVHKNFREAQERCAQGFTEPNSQSGQ